MLERQREVRIEGRETEKKRGEKRENMKKRIESKVEGEVLSKYYIVQYCNSFVTTTSKHISLQASFFFYCIKCRIFGEIQVFDNEHDPTKEGKERAASLTFISHVYWPCTANIT